MSWGNITDLEAWLTSMSIWHCVSLIFNFSLISTMEIGINLNIHILFVGVEISNIWDSLFITRLPPVESANCLRLESKSFEYYKSKYFLLWLKTFWTGKDMSYMRSTYNLNITQVDMFSAVQTRRVILAINFLYPKGEQVFWAFLQMSISEFFITQQLQEKGMTVFKCSVWFQSDKT